MMHALLPLLCSCRAASPAPLQPQHADQIDLIFLGESFEPPKYLEMPFLRSEVMGDLGSRVNLILDVSGESAVRATPVLILHTPTFKGDMGQYLAAADAAGRHVNLVVHTGDEELKADLSWYSAVPRIIRQYWRPEVMGEKVHWMPLGYNFPAVAAAEAPQLRDRQLVLSFSGGSAHSDERKNFFAQFPDKSTLNGMKIAIKDVEWGQWTEEDRSSYRGTMLNSIFAPCPSGHNPECFRLYEAFEAGCIPVAIADAHTDKSFAPLKESGMIFLQSWSEFPALLHKFVAPPNILKEESELQEVQQKVTTWWINKKMEMKQLFAQSMATNAQVTVAQIFNTTL